MNSSFANKKPSTSQSDNENVVLLVSNVPCIGHSSNRTTFWGQRHYLKARNDLELPILMQLPTFLPQLQSKTNYNVETIELKSHTWNTMVLNEQSGEMSNIKLKIHHLRPLPASNEENCAPLNKTNVSPTYSISQPVIVTKDDYKLLKSQNKTNETQNKNLLENATLESENYDDGCLVEVREAIDSELIEIHPQPYKIEVPLIELGTVKYDDNYFINCNGFFY